MYLSPTEGMLGEDDRERGNGPVPAYHPGTGLSILRYWHYCFGVVSGFAVAPIIWWHASVICLA